MEKKDKNTGQTQVIEACSFRGSSREEFKEHQAIK